MFKRIAYFFRHYISILAQRAATKWIILECSYLNALLPVDETHLFNNFTRLLWVKL
jgi:hypothetical protein